jgi:hypothetical protein
MILCLSADQADAALASLALGSIKAFRLGEVADKADGDDSVVFIGES